MRGPFLTAPLLAAERITAAIPAAAWDRINAVEVVEQAASTNDIIDSRDASEGDRVQLACRQLPGNRYVMFFPRG